MPAKSRPEKRSWYKSWLLKGSLLLLLVGLFLGGIIWAGHWGESRLHSERYEVAFADIECEPPVNMTKQDFLDEVQYGPPRQNRQLNLLDKELEQKLREAFERHAWVEKVDAVEITQKQIGVKLTYRRPVLAVKVGAALRAVDANGILLPATAPTAGLPIYPWDAPPPKQNLAGARWGDPNVEAAARKRKSN